MHTSNKANTCCHQRSSKPCNPAATVCAVQQAHFCLSLTDLCPRVSVTPRDLFIEPEDTALAAQQSQKHALFVMLKSRSAGLRPWACTTCTRFTPLSKVTACGAPGLCMLSTFCRHGAQQPLQSASNALAPVEGIRVCASVHSVEPTSYAMVNAYALRTSRLLACVCRQSLEAVNNFHTFGIKMQQCQTLT